MLNGVTRRDVADRARVDRIAPDDPKGALAIAKAIAHPWYRCQSLAKAAEHLQGRARKDALTAAFEAAQEQREPNRVVTVSGWPLRVLASDSPDLAEVRTRELVSLAEEEPHNLRRAHALHSLAFGVQDRPAFLRLIIPALVRAILGGGGSRMDRCIRDTFDIVGSTHPELLLTLALHHKANSQQGKLLERISA